MDGLEIFVVSILLKLVFPNVLISVPSLLRYFIILGLSMEENISINVLPFGFIDIE